MTKTEQWKPTKEMLDLIWVTSGFHPLGSHAERVVAALIAVQPFIAEQASAEALEKAAKRFAGRGDDDYAFHLRAMIEKEPQG